VEWRESIGRSMRSREGKGEIRCKWVWGGGPAKMSLRFVSHTAINELEGGDPARGSAGSRQVKAWRGASD
jgi:hypothetical protein